MHALHGPISPYIRSEWALHPRNLESVSRPTGSNSTPSGNRSVAHSPLHTGRIGRSRQCNENELPNYIVCNPPRWLGRWDQLEGSSRICPTLQSTCQCWEVTMPSSSWIWDCLARRTMLFHYPQGHGSISSFEGSMLPCSQSRRAHYH